MSKSLKILLEDGLVDTSERFLSYSHTFIHFRQMNSAATKSQALFWTLWKRMKQSLCFCGADILEVRQMTNNKKMLSMSVWQWWVLGWKVKERGLESGRGEWGGQGILCKVARPYIKASLSMSKSEPCGWINDQREGNSEFKGPEVQLCLAARRAAEMPGSLKWGSRKSEEIRWREVCTV